MKIIKFIFLAMLFMIMVGCNNNQQNIAVPVESNTPDAMKARELAKASFIKKLAEDMRPNWDYADYFSKVENYTVIVYDDGDSYRVTFTIKNLGDTRFNGGGYLYVVDKKTMQILGEYGSK